jgi:hypothetical protein
MEFMGEAEILSEMFRGEHEMAEKVAREVGFSALAWSGADLPVCG